LRVLQTGGNIHTVSEQIARPDHHVPDMDTNPEAEMTVLRQSGVGLG
jgi:hypothetical protein